MQLWRRSGRVGWCSTRAWQVRLDAHAPSGSALLILHWPPCSTRPNPLPRDCCCHVQTWCRSASPSAMWMCGRSCPRWGGAPPLALSPASSVVGFRVPAPRQERAPHVPCTPHAHPCLLTTHNTHTHTHTHTHTGPNMQSVLLTGGLSLTPGMRDRLEKELGERHQVCARVCVVCGVQRVMGGCCVW